MKNFALGLLIFTMFNCSNNKFSITGTVDSKDTATVKLFKAETPNEVWLTAKRENGKFLIEGNVKDTVLCIIKESKLNRLKFFFLSKGKFTYTSTSKDEKTTSKIEGTKLQENFNTYIGKITEFNKELSNQKKLYGQAKTDEAKKAIYDNYNKINTEKKEFTNNSINTYKGSQLGLLIVNKTYANSVNIKEIKEKLTLLSKKFSKLKLYTDLETRIKTLAQSEVGAKAPDFTMKTKDGKDISLSDLKGKIVLVDFWASWCPPCRAENPNVVKLYKEYKEKGLEIISISLDSKKENWLKAIKDDNMTWIHVSHLKGWNCSTAKKYSVRGIPSLFLLNKEGVIVAKNLRGEKLKEAVEKLIK